MTDDGVRVLAAAATTVELWEIAVRFPAPVTSERTTEVLAMMSCLRT